jgi:hypothetical protein
MGGGGGGGMEMGGGMGGGRGGLAAALGGWRWEVVGVEVEEVDLLRLLVGEEQGQ